MQKLLFTNYHESVTELCWTISSSRLLLPLPQLLAASSIFVVYTKQIFRTVFRMLPQQTATSTTPSRAYYINITGNS